MKNKYLKYIDIEKTIEKFGYDPKPRYDKKEVLLSLIEEGELTINGARRLLGLPLDLEEKISIIDTKEQIARFDRIVFLLLFDNPYP